MINVLLSYWAMWFLLLLGVLINILAKVNYMNHNSPSDIMWTSILKAFFKKEWASYGMSLICTGVFAYQLMFLRHFENLDAKIARYSWIVPLTPIILMLIGILNQWLLYKAIGRITNKGKVDVDILQAEQNQNDKP